MIALVTPSPVYWLLDAIQTLGILGILAGVWMLVLSGPRRRGPRPVKIRYTVDPSPFLQKRRDDRGAGRVETFVAWAVLVGGCAGAWFLVGSFLIGRVQ